MTKWYVWMCSGCGSTLTINYHADNMDYDRIKLSCICEKGEFRYDHEKEGEE